MLARNSRALASGLCCVSAACQKQSSLPRAVVSAVSGVVRSGEGARGFRSTPAAMKLNRFHEKDVAQVFDSMDTDGNGVIDKKEFLTACSELHLTELHAIKRALSRNELSATSVIEASTMQTPSFGSVLQSRLLVLVDVMVTKIFPAGFGWQMASVFAGGAGYEATDMTFFLCTGLGDFTGVLVGHTVGQTILKAFGKKVDIVTAAETGLMLATAAFCSGFVWQPTLNALQTLGYSFNGCAFGVSVSCTMAFFLGLRLSRLMYGDLMDGVEKNTYANLKADVGLSIAIGGATGAFVGTDVSFGSVNWLRPIVGIEDGTGDLFGSVIAGSSTALGFAATQGVQSFIMPRGKCWVD
mmetsp:Transcript_47462/g.115594  ORF Transcript_47462/g.115594 Transcript_47462/m.115594 type:complete len:354 (-) Transcript_47462:290-1351(-)